ncbi:ATP-binding protein [Oscillatoria sp. HE19RPO]|uniref:ATP-binding protein n=1 Tax=Oscillatoria sp. HE19RPO TaxID=2954806 RepID=UPI0020C5452A|nr:ATP-binding protein [Oscillatoria sp. HE19RPO]
MNDSTPPAYPTSNDSSWLRSLGAQLAFTQDASGLYRGFYWSNAENYGLNSQEIIGTFVGDRFKPLSITPYLERVERVLNSRIPERFNYPFRYGDQYFLFELAISPIFPPQGEPLEVLAIGRLLPNALLWGQEEQKGNPQAVASNHLDLHQKFLSTIVSSIRRTLPPGSELYQKLLGEMARKIRRTLDLDTIWNETVNGLGLALGVSRCLICPYQPGSPKVRVVAEYITPPLTPLEGRDLYLAEHPGLNQVLLTQTAVIVGAQEAIASEPESMLVVATSYQDRPNGLICLDRPGILANQAGNANGTESAKTSPLRPWSMAEIELVQELAEQVGTAIAHATLYQELEEARQKAEEISQLKSQFLANTSHELRTPLNGIIGFLKLIVDDMAEDEEEKQEFIKEAYRSAVHLLNLINDVLDIAKIEAGKMELDLVPVKLDELLTGIENHARAHGQEKNLSFQVYKPHTEDEIILYGNYQRLLQVLFNLVGNAIKFTHEGGITITAELMEYPVFFQNQEFPGMVSIAVADTGIGVSLDQQDKLFQSFSQVDGERTRRYGGTGLGLAISQRLIESMGGEVNFYSMGEGLGSTVTFTVLLYQKPVMIFTPNSESLDLLL